MKDRLNTYAWSIVAMMITIIGLVCANNDMRKSIKNIENKIDNVASSTDANIEAVHSALDAVNARLDGIEDKQTQIEKQTYKSFDNLKNELKKQIDELNDRVDGIEIAKEEQTHMETYADAPQAVEEEDHGVIVASAMAIRTENTYMEELEDDGITKKVDPNPVPTGPHLTAESGTFTFEGHTETYYNLDMSVVVQVAQSRGIAGEYHVRSDGVKMLGDYIMVAACYDIHPYGCLMNTSLGMGIVVDTGGFVAWNPTGCDIATTW